MRTSTNRVGRLRSGNGISRREIIRRKAFLDFTVRDARRLAALAPLARKYADEVIEEFYAHFKSFNETRRFFREPRTLERVKRLQKRYFLGLTGGRYGDAYVADRLMVGAVHERIGLDVNYYLGAYRRYLDSVARRLLQPEKPRKPRVEAFLSLLKIVCLDMGLALDNYIVQRERTIRLQNQELAEQYRRVQAANRFNREFLNNLSHELRTPLNAVIGFSELLHDGKAGPLAGRQKEYLGDILASARHLLRMIDDLLDLARVESSRIESGKIPLVPQPVDLTELLHEAEAAFAPQAALKGIRLQTENQAAMTVPVLDQARLRQVLFNYLSNALKFTAAGGRVMARVRTEGEELVLEVEDTGIGIKAQDIPRLFVGFRQLDGSAKKKYPGTGLGLALTRTVVEAQGGKVGVNSKPGEGSTFYARLPLNGKADNAHSDRGEPPVKPPHRPRAHNGTPAAPHGSGAESKTAT